MQFFNIKQKAFTLVELLVVIAIIGLLIALATLTINSYRERARDAKIIGNLNQIRIIAAMINNEKNSYLDLCDNDSLNIDFDFPHGKELRVIEDDLRKNNGGIKSTCYVNTIGSFFCLNSPSPISDKLCLDFTGYIGSELGICDSSAICH